jgi:beta-fructofuranosidase
VFDLPDSWVWDFWTADDGRQHHLFFLYASRALHDPERRHHRAAIGHAVSSDLTEWTRVADALVHDDAPAFDDDATWTGSVVKADDGTWRLFYTGMHLVGDGSNVQKVGVATSPDLLTWTRSPHNPVLEVDARWYETLGETQWRDETWRDPWVFRDPAGNGWHMLITARARAGDLRGRGVVGHAVSSDLERWEARAPLSSPVPDGFGQLEVMQVEEVDGRAVLLFSCLPPEASDAKRRDHPRGAVWAAPGDTMTGPFHIEQAYPLTDDDLYVGRLVRRRGGDWILLAFRNAGIDGHFVGGVTDPMPVSWHNGRLVAEGAR